MQALWNALGEWICMTAWPMETPPSYGAFHLLFTLIFGALSFVGAWKLRKLGDRGNRILLFTAGLILLISEGYKQLFCYFYLENRHYLWEEFPFQLCSVPMYLCLFSPFLKSEKLQRSMYTFMMIYNLLGGAISFAEPSGLLLPYWTLTLHACFWHMSLVFIGLYLGFSNRAGKTKKDYWAATKMFIVLCGIAFAINVAFRKISCGTINMFFVGPSDSPLIVFDQISQLFGWYISTALYIPVVCLGGYLVFLIFYLTHKRRVLSRV